MDTCSCWSGMGCVGLTSIDCSCCGLDSLAGGGELSCVGVISDTNVPAWDAFGVIGDACGMVVVDSDTANGGSASVIGDV